MSAKDAEERNNELLREKYRTKRILDLKPLTISIELNLVIVLYIYIPTNCTQSIFL